MARLTQVSSENVRFGLPRPIASWLGMLDAMTASGRLK